MKFRIQVFAVQFTESYTCICFTLGLNWICFSRSHHRAPEQLSLWHQRCRRALCWSRSRTRASLTHVTVPVPRSSVRPFSFRVLHFLCIYTNTPIHWCSTNWHSTSSVSKSYHSVKYDSEGQAPFCFSVQVFFWIFTTGTIAFLVQKSFHYVSTPSFVLCRWNITLVVALAFTPNKFLPH